MIVLGLSKLSPSSIGHDSTASILVDGKIEASMSEERFSRVKHSGGFPSRAIQFCLEEAGIRLNEVDKVAVGNGLRPEFVKEKVGKFSFSAKSDPVFRMTALEQKKPIFYNHQYIHARTGYLLSGFNNAVIISLDGAGIDNEKDSSGGIFLSKNNEIEPLKIFPASNSLGYVFGSVTEICGFRMLDGEGKTMSLAAFAEKESREEKEIVYQHVKRLFPKVNGIELSENGVSNPAIKIKDDEMILANTDERVVLLGKIFKKELIAWAAQKILEETVCELVRNVVDHTGIKNVVFSGGVFLNMILNMKIRENLDKNYNLFFNPICSDHGNAIGVAVEQHIEETGENLSFPNLSLYLGSSFLDEEIEAGLKRMNLDFEKIDKVQQGAELISKGKIVGWFQGRAELGPRGLGNRSILALSNDIEFKNIVNNKVKKRESWRPFCPSITDKNSARMLENPCDAPYMILGFHMKNPKEHPAVCHVDGTTRPQILERQKNPEFYSLIDELGGVVLNTSLNLAGDPIVESPLDAIRTFKNSEMDALIMNDYLIKRV